MWHLQYNDWQEQGLPRNVSSYLQFLEELSELRRLTVSKTRAGDPDPHGFVFISPFGSRREILENATEKGHFYKV